MFVDSVLLWPFKGYLLSTDTDLETKLCLILPLISPPHPSPLSGEVGTQTRGPIVRATSALHVM